MKQISTMNLDQITTQSLYLQELFLKLSDNQLRELLVAPRQEFVESLKMRLRVIYENGREGA